MAKRGAPKRKEPDHLINEQIRSEELRVIVDGEEPLGVLGREEALQKAKDVGLDLVLISPTAKPPVCKIIDYGKFRYEEEKKKKDAKRKQKKITLKEVRFRPKIDKHDFDYKLKRFKKFIDDGDKVKVTLMYRGRELAHTEIGNAVLDKIKEEVKDYAKLEKEGHLEGRRRVLIFAPTK